MAISCNKTPSPTGAQPPVPVGSHDSPIDVAGGSIHINDNDSAGIVPCASDTSVYCAYSNNPAVLSLSGVVGYQSPPAMTGWEISLSNKDASHPKYPHAVTLCTDINCSLAAPQNDTIYIKIADGAQWLTDNSAKPKELDFHDQKHCNKNPPAEDATCDHLVDVTIRFAGVSYPAGVAPALPCNNGKAGHCNIHIGN